MDKVSLWHKIDPSGDDPGRDWHKVELHATDARFAVQVDPEHWSADDPRAPVEVMPVAEPESDEEQS